MATSCVAKQSTELVNFVGMFSKFKSLILSIQLINHLKEYIKSRDLFDPHNPSMVYCSTDPLKHVFGVDKFTIQDAM